MRNRLWDAFESFLAELLVVEEVPVREAVPMACRAFAEEPVGYLVLSLVSAAHVFDTGKLSEGSQDKALAQDLYQAAAVIAADLAMFQIVGRNAPDCGGLLEHWKATADGYFSV